MKTFYEVDNELDRVVGNSPRRACHCSQKPAAAAGGGTMVVTSVESKEERVRFQQKMWHAYNYRDRSSGDVSK